MVDSHGDRDTARFQLREHGLAAWLLDIQYRDTTMQIVFPRGKEGPGELRNLYDALPNMVRVVLSEIEIRDAMQDVDVEIEGLLGEGE